MKKPLTRKFIFLLCLGAALQVSSKRVDAVDSELLEDSGIKYKSRSIELQGLHAYPNRESVPAGEIIDFHVSSQVPYRFRVTKLGHEVDDRDSDETIFLAAKKKPAKVQAIHPGAYVRVKKSLPADTELNALTLECWVRPWKLNAWQGILTQYDYPANCGFGLFLDKEGRVVFSIGNGSEYEATSKVLGPKLTQQQWHHLVATWDGETAVIWIDGVRGGEWKAPKGLSPRKAGSAQLRIGAYGDKGEVNHFFDGDIATPAIYTRVLNDKKIAEKFVARGLKAPDLTDKSLAAFWPLDEERGNKIADASGNGHDGEIINLGNWMTGGPSFDGSKVGRFDQSYDPAADAKRGHALRLASDALYDCGWDVSESFSIPKDAKSGLYAAWFEFDFDGKPHRYPVTFIVNKAKDAAKAPLAVMCSTNTWRAYGGASFAKNVPRENRNWSTGGQVNDPANPPAYCFYRDHVAGQPAYQLGLRMPWPVAGPEVRYSAPEVGYSHLMRGERFTHVWLEKQGYDFDVITNLDLHRDPDLLDGYKALIINGHDEYWSAEMYNGLDHYLKNGGSTAVLSGNSLFWRVTIDDELGVIECRKIDTSLGGRKHAASGEIYHSYDAKRGGLMRHSGYPSWAVIGLDMSYWWSSAKSGSYTAKAADHFLFQKPEQIDFSDRMTFGGARSGYRQACGHEGDIRLSSFAPTKQGAPEGAAFPEEPSGIKTLAKFELKNNTVLDYFGRPHQPEKATFAEMIYWERPSGGKVFNAGTIGFGWALDVDPKQTKLMRNVLFHLAGVKAKTPYDPEWLDSPGPKTEAPSHVERVQPKGNQPAPVNPAKDGVFTLIGQTAEIFGESISLIKSADKNHPEASIDGWMKKGERAEWKLNGLKAGSYDVLVDWAMPRIPGGLQKAAMLLDGKQIFTASIRTTEGIDKFASYVIGTVELPAGEHVISFGPNGGVKERWLRLRSLRLVPAASEVGFTVPVMTVPKGFTIEPVAIPPLVSHPMMACFDDLGRMFVAESAGSNAKAPELLKTRPHKILMLEDENGDGVFDKSTVFAENLVLPNGVQWLDGALYVCSPPYIWRFEDTTGDGHADKQTPIGGKFAFNGMSSGFHGPVLGPDGRLYYTGGQHGWTLGDTTEGLNFEGPWISRAPGVFSMWPDGSDAENRAQGGLANPVEVTFSSEGEVFGSVAVYQHLNGRTDALLHWIHGSVYNLRRDPVHARTSRNLLLPVSRRGWVAPSGLTRYRSGVFGDDYRNDIFLSEFNTHRIYRIKPGRQGASYTSSDEVFLESTNPYTHFTDAFEDADGSLLAVDTGGWFLYGCPTSAISRPGIKGGIYRIRKSGAKKIDDPRGLKLDWKNPKIEWLDDSRFTVRDRAMMELAKLGEPIVPRLQGILLHSDKASSERYRRNVVWTLTRIDLPSARAAVRVAFGDPSASVRLTAARSASTRRDAAAGEKLMELIIDDKAQVVREAATALGRIGHAPAVPALFDAVAANEGDDPYLDHSLIYALIEIDAWKATHKGLTHASTHVQRAALIALAEMKSSQLTAEQTAPFLASSDAGLRAEALRLATARSDWGGSLTSFLKTSLHAKGSSSDTVDALLAFTGASEVQSLLADALNASSSARATSLEVMARSQLKTVPESWSIALQKLLVEHPDDAAVRAVGHLKISSVDVALVKIANDTKASAKLRLAALDVAVDRLPEPLDAMHFDFLTARAQPDNSTKQRIEAVRILARAALSEKQRIICAGKTVTEAGSLQIGPLLGVFEKKMTGKVRSALTQSLENSLGLFSLSASRLESLFTGHVEIAQPLIDKLRAQETQREQRLNELVKKIAKHKGNPERGKVAYTKATCIVCHTAKGEGGVIGPELTTIGSIRSERDLLEAIAFPSATFAREYEPFIIKLHDGTVRMGRVGAESEDSLDLIDAQGIATPIPTAQIASREMAPISMMPPGLERILSDVELADLLAYLRSLK
ncbi:MAG: HEAT repeat domain-containing protein [Verrucomicrobiales bacterium]|nr:HEAT repeat domain-containing protein [Verrucomicrobiales bacterium]